MILTDREIKNSIASGLIVIDPSPDERAYAATSVDLTLASIIHVYKDPTPGLESAIDHFLCEFTRNNWCVLHAR